MSDKPKILIVDDVQANIIALEYLLVDSFSNIEILSASSGDEALKIAFSEDISLIILDIQMPIMDGFEVATFLKSNKKTKEIPIIFLTAAFKEEEFQKRGFHIGAIDYLTKPINNAQFINKLSLYIEIFTKNRQLQELNNINKKQSSILQSILDADENLVLATDGATAAYVNNSFLDFFDVQNMKEFTKKYTSIVKLLMSTAETSFDIENLSQENASCATLFALLQETKEEKRIVSILDKDEVKKSFFLNVTVVEDGTSHEGTYLLIFTDITKIKKEQDRVRRQANTDGLTGIYNRTKFNEILQHELNNAKRYKRKLTCALLDIDHFKHFNDTYGHLVGDEVLVLLVNTIQKNIRSADVFARWGGEEFVFIFPETDIKAALEIVEYLRQHIKDAKHPKSEHITASFGVTEFLESDTIGSIFQRCDDALYEAKDNGRNCVVVK